MIIDILFWISVAFVLYVYLGYPSTLALMSLFIQKPVQRSPITPSVSLVITAYNEEKRIREKLENTLRQDYPRGRYEIVVASDSSTDGTDEIVRSYAQQGVRLVRLSERKGKEAAQKAAVDATSGELLVFSDTATILLEHAVSSIVQNFADPTVGCVSSVDRFVDVHGKVSGEGAYVRYEMLLRTLETKVNTLVGLSGSFFAARREVCRPWAVDMQSDFNTLLNAVKMGLRGVSDPLSIGYYKNIADERKEYERKIRTVLRGISVFMNSLPMLDPFRYRLFTWQLLSHKLGRWLVPFAMISAFLCNALLVHRSSIYLASFILQTSFYAIAVIGLWATRSSVPAWLKLPSFLILANVSILRAWYLYLTGERMIAWEPSKR